MFPQNSNSSKVDGIVLIFTLLILLSRIEETLSFKTFNFTAYSKISLRKVKSFKTCPYDKSSTSRDGNTFMSEIFIKSSEIMLY